jgi:choline dehydrogenase-like flavoprotein
MLIDGNAPVHDSVRSADVLIVGAGAVGLVLGILLGRAGRRVTIVEAGDRTPSADYIADNWGPSTGMPHKGLLDGRMKALGGTTRLWGGQLLPFGRSDFQRSYAGKPDWPVQYDDIAPWFSRAFDLLDISPEDLDENRIWASTGNRAPDLGPYLHVGMNIWLPTPDFTQFFKKEIADLSTLSIVTNIEAQKLIFNPGGSVVGIECNSVEGRKLFSGLEVVLANGTLEISRLLLRAAATTPNCPFRDNQNIGRGFVDHLHGLAGRVEDLDKKNLSQIFDNVYFHGRKYGVKIRASERFVQERGIGNCAGTLNGKISIGQSVSDLRLLVKRIVSDGDWRQFGTTFVTSLSMLRVLSPLIFRYLVRRRSFNLFEHGVYLGLELEQIVNPECRLFLDPAKPPQVAAIGLHWAFDGREMDAAAEFCTEIAARFEQQHLGRIVLDPRILARDPAFLADCHDAYHQIGGARMAESAATGVVDRNLRVFGTTNLSILGAAVFPSGSFANPTFTAMAFAHRLADRLSVALATKRGSA